METQLFSIGHRFHGNMLTTGTNRPGIVILHDERTSELSNGLQIPRISQKNFMEASKSANPLLEMLSQVEFDSTQFQKTRKLLAAEWVKLSNVTGVKISDYVGKIAGDVN
jgi:polysaccharide pyruvyl transferase WcaK-like protein